MSKIQRSLIAVGCLVAVLLAVNPPVSQFGQDGRQISEVQSWWIGDIPINGRVNTASLATRLGLVAAVTAALVFAFKPSKQ